MSENEFTTETDRARFWYKSSLEKEGGITPVAQKQQLFFMNLCLQDFTLKWRRISNRVEFELQASLSDRQNYVALGLARTATMVSLYAKYYISLIVPVSNFVNQVIVLLGREMPIIMYKFCHGRQSCSINTNQTMIFSNIQTPILKKHFLPSAVQGIIDGKERKLGKFFLVCLQWQRIKELFDCARRNESVIYLSTIYAS